MPSALVAAAPASRPDASARECGWCGDGLSGPLAPHVCASCGKPQAVARASEDYFTAFGLPRRFGVDPEALQKRFYELSRALHPDRFSTASVDVRVASVERMSFVNDAYTVLKDGARRRAYLMELEGVKPAESGGAVKAQVPLELAEAWFELQEALADGGLEAGAKLADFESDLGDRLRAKELDLEELEKAYDAAPAHGLLERMAAVTREKSYLVSLQRDIERIKARLELSR